MSVVASVGDEGIEVIRSVYPARSADAVPRRDRCGRSSADLPARSCTTRRPGIVLAVDLRTLVALARRHVGVIEFVPQVGDFVAKDEPLFACTAEPRRSTKQDLRATVAFGPERTLEQDPMFAFRILVDIALKALSPAINDPTTAVLAIDQVHRLLRFVGHHRLRGEVIADDRGRATRDLPHAELGGLRAPGVHAKSARAAPTACRSCAACAPCSRTDAHVPEYRRPALEAELDLLDRTIDANFAYPEDRALARMPDVQGLGGAPPTHLR